MYSYSSMDIFYKAAFTKRLDIKFKYIFNEQARGNDFKDILNEVFRGRNLETRLKMEPNMEVSSVKCNYTCFFSITVHYKVKQYYACQI